ncbi:hypothetical protein ACWDV7_26850 [Streptomyces sp. NPDC003362]
MVLARYKALGVGAAGERLEELGELQVMGVFSWSMAVWSGMRPATAVRMAPRLTP